MRRCIDASTLSWTLSSSSFFSWHIQSFCVVSGISVLLCCLYCFWWFLSISLRTCLCNLWGDVSMHQRSLERCPLPPSFLDIYSLSVLSLECKAVCIVMSFLLLLSICLIFSLVRFKNVPVYHTMGQPRCLYLDEISTMKFGFELFACSHEVFVFFFLTSTHVLKLPFPIFPNIYKFPFLRAFWFFFYLIVLFLQSFAVFCFSLIA